MTPNRRRGGALRNAAALFASSSSARTSKLFVGGLSYDTNETALKDAFSQYGHVIAGYMPSNHGFVIFSSQDEAAAAVHKMNGEVLDGRNIRVHYSSN